MPRVLLVDDDSKVRTVFRLMLERAGFEVVEAGDGKRGIRAFREGRIDVILCDLFMPGTDGLELIRELHQDCPGVKIIAMSGGSFNGSADMLPIAQLLGASEVLTKPFDQAAALAAINRVLMPDSGPQLETAHLACSSSNSTSR
jgi:CheY-like chemotaxis protein